MPEQSGQPRLAVTPPTLQRQADGPSRPRLALAIIVLCDVMLVLDGTVMNIALPQIRTDLHFSATGLSWVINAYTLAFGGLLLLGGRAGDVFGRRRMFLFGTIVFTAASLAGGLALSGPWLVAARVLQGAGAAMAGPSMLALLTSTFTDQHSRAHALAVLSGIGSVGLALGLVLGGILTHIATWRSALFINVPTGATIAILTPRLIREPVHHRVRLDLSGAVTAIAGMVALVYGFVRAASTGRADRTTMLTVTAGLVLIIALVILEHHVLEPLVPPRLLADRNRAAAYLACFLFPMVMVAMFFFLTQYLQLARGFSTLTTGLAFLPFAATAFAANKAAGALLSKTGVRPLILAGALLLLSSLAWFAQLSPTTPYVSGLLGPMMLMGGAALAFAPLNMIIMSTVPSRDAGAAGGILQATQQLGGPIGLAILVAIFGAATHHHATSPAQLAVGITTTLTAATIIVICIIGAALTLTNADHADIAEYRHR